MYLYEMAKTKRDVKNYLEYHCENILLHLLMTYATEDSRKHHIVEIFSQLKDVPKLAHTNKYPSYDFIHSILWDEWQDIQDNKFLGLLDLMDVKYPDFDNNVNKEQFFNFAKEYIDWLCEKLSSVGLVRLSEVRLKLDELLTKYEVI